MVIRNFYTFSLNKRIVLSVLPAFITKYFFKIFLSIAYFDYYLYFIFKILIVTNQKTKSNLSRFFCDKLMIKFFFVTVFVTKYKL